MREKLTLEQLQEVARKRHVIHKHQRSSRPLSVDYELLGLMGEEAFAWTFGLGTSYLDLKVQGDGREDFRLPLTLSIDVKAAEKPYNLLREAGKPHADILVLCGVSRDPWRARLLGWAYDAEMVLQPTKDFGYGVINHYLPKERLRPMRELKEKVYRVRAEVEVFEIAREKFGEAS